MSDVALVAKREPMMTGTARYAENLAAALVEQGVAVARGETFGLPLRGQIGRLAPGLAGRLGAFFDNYPLGMRAPPARVLHLTMESLATALFTNRRREPVVLTVHDVISYLTRKEPALRAYAHPVHELFDRLSLAAFSKADRLIADSAWTAEAVARHTGYPRERIHVVPLAVDHARFRPEGPPDPIVAAAAAVDDPVVGFVGALKPRKNLLALVRALPAIRERVPAVRLLAAGAGAPEEAERVRRAAAELGVGDRVTLLGPVPDDAVPALYRRAAVVAVPSLYEGFGLPALEAMACGAAVVASARSSLPEVVGQAGITCEPEPAAIAAAVVSILLDAELRARLGAGALERARGFTWERTASLTRAVYRTAIEGSSTSAHSSPARQR